jgi:hypothetical protein
MTDLDSEIGELFKKQGSGLTETDYRAQVDKAAAELFTRQPPDVGLPIKAFQAIVVSLLADYQLPLDEIKKRIRKSGLKQHSR